MRFVSSILRLSICVCSGTMMLPSSSAITESDTACSSIVKPRVRRADDVDYVHVESSRSRSACRCADRVKPVARRGRESGVA